jgi:hypothetical protein
VSAVLGKTAGFVKILRSLRVKNGPGTERSRKRSAEIDTTYQRAAFHSGSAAVSNGLEADHEGQYASNG